jgi:hypothetical protein
VNLSLTMISKEKKLMVTLKKNQINLQDDPVPLPEQLKYLIETPRA